MYFWLRSLLRSSPSDRQRTLSSPDPLPVLGKDPMNKHSATCLDLSTYHNHQAKLLESLLPPITSTSSFSTSPAISPFPTSRQLDSPASFTSSLWDTDGTQTIGSRDIQTPHSGEDKSPSLQHSHKSLGNAPAIPHIRRNAYDVTSVETAVKLLQRVATHHDVDRSVRAVRNWLKSLSRFDSANATASIRSAAIEHFSHIWHPVRTSAPSPLKLSQLAPGIEQLHEKALTVGNIVARLLAQLFRVNIVESTDIALAAEYLFRYRHREGSMKALHELISISRDRAYDYAALERMVVVADGLQTTEKELSCSHEMKFYAGVSFSRLIHHLKMLMEVYLRKAYASSITLGKGNHFGCWLILSVQKSGYDFARKVGHFYIVILVIKEFKVMLSLGRM